MLLDKALISQQFLSVSCNWGLTGTLNFSCRDFIQAVTSARSLELIQGPRLGHPGIYEDELEIDSHQISLFLHGLLVSLVSLTHTQHLNAFLLLE
jgi:hypothetical protein